MRDRTGRYARETAEARARRLVCLKKYRNEHKAAAKAYMKQWVEEHREHVRAYHKTYRENHALDEMRYRAEHKRDHQNHHLKAKYGITVDDYDRMLAAQGGGCAICGGPPRARYHRFHVDHNHETGIVRGLLCDNCNHIVGRMQDNPEILQAAANYLRRCEIKKVGEAR
jgi:ferric-dicitrate binding protein FerR (iron transport regulator)